MHLVHMGCFLLISLADGSPFKKNRTPNPRKLFFSFCKKTQEAIYLSICYLVVSF